MKATLEALYGEEPKQMESCMLEEGILSCEEMEVGYFHIVNLGIVGNILLLYLMVDVCNTRMC